MGKIKPKGQKPPRRTSRVPMFFLMVIVLFALAYFGLLHYSVVPVGRRTGVPIDVVGVSRKPTCVTRESIQRLNRFLGPKRIFVVTTAEEFCSVFKRHASNVQCLLENNLMQGVSADSIAAYLQGRYSVNGSQEVMGHKISGWYLQQFLKMGAGQYIEDLTQYFLVWDLDMLLLKPLDIFYRPRYLMGTSGPFSGKTVVNIGGANNFGYEYSYHKLTGRELEFAHDGTSFVAHWMLMFQPYINELLDAIVSTTKPHEDGIENNGEKTGIGGSPQWIWRILDSLHPAYIRKGFSEYASYASWVKQHHPGSQYILKKRTWRRHPLGGRYMIWLSRFLQKDRLCCPHSSITAVMEFFGYQYVGFEIGHAESCKFTDRRYDHGYGVK